MCSTAVQGWCVSTVDSACVPIANRVCAHLCTSELRVGGMCKEHGATGRYRVVLRRAAGVSTRAFANHFFSRLKFVGLRSPNRNNPNKYHSMPDDTDEYSRADYFNDPYNSRDLNPTEPMDHGCGSRRE